MEELNRRFMEVKEKMRIKQKLLSVLNDLEQKYIEEKSRFAKLENVLQKEGKDVTKWLLEVQNDMDIYIFKIGYDSWRDRKSTRLNSSHPSRSRMPSSA